MSETNLVSDILKYFKLKNIVAFRMPLGPVIHGGVRKKNPLKHFPDIMGIFPDRCGRMFTIEAKVGKNKLSEGQEAMRLLLLSAGVTTIVAYDLDDVIDYFE